MSTLKHFGQGDKINYRFMEGKKHCEYNGQYDENGVTVFGQPIAEFISDVQQKP